MGHCATISLRRIVILLAMGALALCCSTQSQISDPHIIASVRGVTFTTDDWAHDMDQSQVLREARFPTRELAERTVRQRISAHLLDQIDRREIEERALAETDEGRARLARVERTAIARWVREVELPNSISITDEEIARALRERGDQFQRPDTFTFHHLFLDLSGLDRQEAESRRALAREMVDQLRINPERFAELEAEHSEAVGFEPGHVYGPVLARQIPGEPGQVLERLAEGEVSDPVESPEGIHILQMVERIQHSPSLEDSRELLRESLMEERMEELIEERVARAEEELGLILHPAPDRLEADTPVLSGSTSLAGEELALSRWNDISSAPQGEELTALVQATQRSAVLAALARRRGWAENPDLEGRLESVRIRALRTLLWKQRWSDLEPITEEMARTHWRMSIGQWTESLRMQVEVLELRPSAGEGSETISMRDLMERAEVIRDLWETGEDTEELTRLRIASMDISSEVSLRWISPLTQDRELRDTVAHLATGEISQPLPLSNGCALFHVLTVERDVPLPFEEVEPSVRGALQAHQRREFAVTRETQIRSEIAWDIPEELILYHVEASSFDR
jgi:PPIC-type PPIASE domain